MLTAVVVLTSSALLSAAVAAGPSFDCATAKLPDDLAICASDELSSLERTMVYDFQYAMSVGDPGAVRELARSNLRKRRACKSDVACLRYALVAATRSYHDQDTPEPLPASPIAPAVMDAPSLGLTVTDLSGDVADKFGVPASGVLVVKVLERGPADTAGIKRNDVILKFNGKIVRNAKDLVSQLQASASGVDLPIVFAREGDQGLMTVRLR
jgi:uncharacterized protein